MLSKKFFDELEKPFPIEDVGVRIGMKRGKAGLALLYLDAEAVRKRFDLTCAMEGATWSYDFQIVASPSDHVATNIDSKALAIKATITVFKDGVSISRSSIGEEPFMSEKKEDNKNAETDANKRAIIEQMMTGTSHKNAETDANKRDAARNEREVYKNAETDAFKRAAARFGVGGYLRHLDKMWFPLNDNGYFAENETEIIKKVYETSDVKVEDTSFLVSEIVKRLEEGIAAVKDSLKKPCPFLDEAFREEFEKKNGLKRGSWWSIQTILGTPIRYFSYEEMQVIAKKIGANVNESNFEAALVLSKALPIAAQYPEHFGMPKGTTVKTLLSLRLNEDGSVVTPQPVDKPVKK